MDRFPSGELPTAAESCLSDSVEGTLTESCGVGGSFLNLNSSRKRKAPTLWNLLLNFNAEHILRLKNQAERVSTTTPRLKGLLMLQN